MYSTCIHCHGDLGINEALEAFPVGRRLAFDAAKGRLWVVCPHCARWNLSPLEERWEAIEAAERRFRDARLRVHTDEIGMARLAEGLDLIRIGQPRRPEFAAWRYGDQLGTRMRRSLVRLGVGSALGGAAASAAILSGVAGLALAFPPAILWGVMGGVSAVRAYRDGLRWFRVPATNGRLHTMFGAHLKETHLEPVEGGEGWTLTLRHVGGFERVEGADARRALAVLLPRVNTFGAGRELARASAEAIGDAGGPEPFIAAVAAESGRLSAGYAERRERFRRTGSVSTGTWEDPFDPNVEFGTKAPIDQGALPRLAASYRLALEMAVHEETERRAMEGEMAVLEAAWREAEQIAAIADRLTVPPAVEAEIARMRREAAGAPRDSGGRAPMHPAD
jgi:hypothetical protein